jgi:rhamnosyl/mannosyltransferase
VVWFHSDIIRQRVFYWAYRPFLRAALRKAKAIVVASPNHVRYTPILQEFADKCYVIPYGIDMDRFRLDADRQPRVAKIRGNGGLPIVLFIGRFAYYKGLEYLVDAMWVIRARLILIGSGPMEKEIRERARAVKTPGSIEFTGELPEEELIAHLHACDLLVLPSVERSEAFGVVQIEAMACGKPVVSCRIPSGVPWVNRHGETGLTVPPRDAEALAGAINTLLEDPRRRELLGRNGQLRVEREFTIERMTTAFWEVLEMAQKDRVPDGYRYDPHDTVSVG